MGDVAAAYRGTNEDQQFSLTLTSDRRVPPDGGKSVFVVATGPIFVMGVVLSAACGNVMGTLLARSVARRREIAVRLAIGPRGRASCGSSGAVAKLAMAWTLLRWIAMEAPEPLIRFALGFVIEARAFLFTATAATGADVLAPLVPALQASGPSLLRDLNGAVPLAGGGRGRWFLPDA